jgi:predicted transcriptional regulator
MPTLPTLNITNQAIWDRLFAAFNGDAAEYKEWLKAQLIEKVRQAESQSAGQQAAADMQQGIPSS